MADPYSASNPTVNAENPIADLLAAPLGPDWTIDGLADQLLNQIATRPVSESSDCVIDSEDLKDRQSRRLIRPLLACLATRSAAEAGTPVHLYEGLLSFQRIGPDGPVWITGQFENKPGSVRATFQRTASPPPSTNGTKPTTPLKSIFSPSLSATS